MNYVRLGNSGLKITELVFGSALTIGTEIMEENNEPREEVKTAIDYIDKVMDERNPFQIEIEGYKKQMELGMFVFVIMFGLSLCYCIICEELGSQIITS